MYECKIDGFEAKSLLGLTLHLRFLKISLIEYMVKYEKFEIPKCPYCNNDRKLIKGLSFCYTCCSLECKKMMYNTRKHTEKTKEKIRQQRFKYLSKKTGKTAWERRCVGDMSYLEQWFFDKIIIDNDLLNIYDIINEYPVYPYFIDFAFLNIKLAIEIDGYVHEKRNKQKEHDIIKDNFLNKNGWKILRISYEYCIDENIDDILTHIRKHQYNTKILENTLYKHNPFKKKHRTRKEYIEDKIEKNNEKNKENINLILNSNIDLSKRGSKKEVAKLLNIKHQKVAKWLKRYMPNLIE